MKIDNLYPEVYNLSNLLLAWKKARRGKTKKNYITDFEKNLGENLRQLKFELMSQTYQPKSLVTFILRDPKTRRISKSAFRDRIVHYALVRVLEPIFDKCFIYDSCANRIGKGNLFALKRFDLFKRRVTNNLKTEAFCFKADIKHYFQEINHIVLIYIISRKIKDENLIGLIKKILMNGQNKIGAGSQSALCQFANKDSAKPDCSGMPLGNLTSQFFANVYLNELDYFVKHRLKAKYYIRYVDDFVILHNSKEQLEIWKREIDRFLKKELKLELHPQKSKIISLSRGIDFVGFRNFYYHRLLRKRNIRNMADKIKRYNNEEINKEKLLESFQGWNAYAKWANGYKLRKRVRKSINIDQNP